MTLDDMRTGLAFQAYAEQCLAPTLQCGDIERTGAKLLFLSPYSPDFNPIEMAFSKMKALLKKVGARKLEERWDAVAHAIDVRYQKLF
jgi:transposase